ncbi:CRAL-TRIO domain-containing protein [Leptodontidium sp. 2 PMI_412]|nr:CRAL-TRIO domain-containing protein [Leptodontidium sp. 2 PMI_412]
MDLKGVGLSNASSVYSNVRQVAAMSQNYCPERLGKLYMIKARWGYSTDFRIDKGWLDPATVEKIHILEGNYQNDLLAQIPAENLRKKLGGTCEYPGGCAWSDEGPSQDPLFLN